MKKLIVLLVILVCIFQSYGQVGINTTEPTATLDVNGTIRIRDFNANNHGDAVEIVGLDEQGNLVDVTVGENLILENNVLRVVENRYRSASTDIITAGQLDNYDLIILPGEPNDDKKIIKIKTSGGFLSITGIKAGEDGQMIWLMAYSNSVKLLGLNSDSDPENQFLINNAQTIAQYEMVQLVYDGTLQKWLLMEN